MVKVEANGRQFFRERKLQIQGDTSQFVVAATDTYLKGHLEGNMKHLLRSAKWRSEPATSGQIKYLRQLGSKIFSPSVFEALKTSSKGDLELMITLLRFGRSSVLRGKNDVSDIQ